MSPTRRPRGPLPAVRGVSLSVAAGESVGVAGESGCGKSTLASTVLRLQPKSAKVEGEVLLDGEDMQTMPVGPAARGALGRGVDGLPGRPALAQPACSRSVDQLAEPMRLHDPSDHEEPGRRTGAASCSSRSVSRPAAPRRTRTSSPAARSSG